MLTNHTKPTLALLTAASLSAHLPTLTPTTTLTLTLLALTALSLTHPHLRAALLSLTTLSLLLTHPHTGDLLLATTVILSALIIRAHPNAHVPHTTPAHNTHINPTQTAPNAHAA